MRSPPSSTLERFGLALAIFTILVAIIATQWPFDYHLTSYGLGRRWARVDWNRMARRPSGAIRIDRDLYQNLAMFIPLGFGYALWSRARGIRIVITSLVIGLVASSLLEVGQLLTPHRYTTWADVWRNALGCLVGAWAVVAVRSTRFTAPAPPRHR